MVFRIDTFCFNGEWVVPMRLAYLAPVVDAFVIVEAWETHSGIRKPFLYKDRCREWFEPYLDKIHWVVVESFPDITETWKATYAGQSWMLDNDAAWFREAYQRDVAGGYIRNHFKCPYLVHVSDADEIPRREILGSWGYAQVGLGAGPIYLLQDFYYYNFHWKKPYPWMRAYILTENEMTRSFTEWRVVVPPNRWIQQGGWHFSYFMTVDALQKKLAGFAHRECDQPQWRTVEHIQACIAKGLDLFEREGGETLVWVNDPLKDGGFPVEFNPWVCKSRRFVNPVGEC
jgi:beta-1,4-mannosyl-glycoprotein beta-1,4-N-acetylglucosaminyltransferase